MDYLFEIYITIFHRISVNLPQLGIYTKTKVRYAQYSLESLLNASTFLLVKIKRNNSKNLQTYRQTYIKLYCLLTTFVKIKQNSCNIYFLWFSSFEVLLNECVAYVPSLFCQSFKVFRTDQTEKSLGKFKLFNNRTIAMQRIKFNSIRNIAIQIKFIVKICTNSQAKIIVSHTSLYSPDGAFIVRYIFIYIFFSECLFVKRDQAFPL